MISVKDNAFPDYKINFCFGYKIASHLPTSRRNKFQEPYLIPKAKK